MRPLDCSDPAALEAALEALPEGTWVRVVDDQDGAWGVRRVPGGWYLVGDVVVASGDVCDGLPLRVDVLDADDLARAGDDWLFGEDPGDLPVDASEDWEGSHWNAGEATRVEPWDWPQAPAP